MPGSRSDQKKRQAAFLAAYVECAVVSYAALAAKVSRDQVYAWKRDDPEFLEKFNEADEMAGDLLIKEARRRAIQGCRKMLFHQGKPIIDPETGQPYFEFTYSDQVLIRLLEARFPQDFKQNISHDFKKLSNDELIAECAKSGIYFGTPERAAK